MEVIMGSQVNQSLVFDIINYPFLEELYVADVDVFTIEPLVKELNRFLVGQTEAKKKLSLGILTHDLILEYNANNPDKELKKSNLLLTGPSGVGKTFLVETLCKILGKKLVTVDITTFSQTGYVGREVSEILDDIMDAVEGDSEEAKNVIVFLDEIDKLGIVDSERSVSTTGVQRSLLKLVEGSDLVSKKNALNTKDILFVFGGSFSQFTTITNDDIDSYSVSSLSPAKRADKVTEITYDNLIASGILPELAGRIGNIIQLHHLGEKDLKNILLTSESSPLKQLTTIFELRGQKLSLTKKEIGDIIKESVDRKLGARGLKQVLETYVYNKYYK